MQRTRSRLILGSIVVLAACGSDSPPSPRRADSERLPQVVGVVRDRAGAPVAGAAVSLHPVLESSSRAVDVVLLTTVLQPGPNLGKTRTDGLGRFALEMPVRSILADEEYVLCVRHPDFAANAAYFVTPWDLSTLDQPITLNQGRVVEGEVLDPERRPIVGAELEAFSNVGSGMGGDLLLLVDRARTDQQGRFVLRYTGELTSLTTRTPGGAVRRAWVDNGLLSHRVEPPLTLVEPRPGAVVESPDQSETRRSSRPRDDHDGRATAIAGRVLDQASHRPVSLFALRVPDSSGDALSPRNARPVTSEDGRFSLDRAPRGPFRLCVRAPGYAERCVAVDATTHSCGDVLLDRGTDISGTVVDAEGRPVGEARVHVQPFGPPLDPLASVAMQAAWCDFPQAFTDASGRYTIEHVQPAALCVVAAHPDCAPAMSRRLVVTNEPVTVEPLHLEPAGTIEGRVVGPAASLRFPHLRLREFTIPVRDGRFRIGGLPPGRYEFVGPATGCVVNTTPVEVAVNHIPEVEINPD